jgi:uncharacterized protein YkwD
MTITKKLLIGGAVVLTLPLGYLTLSNLLGSDIKQLPGVSTSKPIEPDVSDIDKTALLTLTNAERIKAGLPALINNPKLEQSALDKCNDMVARNYWDHFDPDGNAPWQFIQRYTKYNFAGENLAQGQPSAGIVVSAWMASPGHKDNILKSTFNQVGFAVCESQDFIGGGNKLITVQHFIGL